MFILPFEKIAYANCPVCILTVGGGLMIAKKLGIDDLLVSIWISGLNTAIAYWWASTIKISEDKVGYWAYWESFKKVFKNPLNMSFAFYLMTVVYLWTTNQLNHPNNRFYGMDKIMFGMTVGLITFILAGSIDKFIRAKNNGKVLFYYQKVIIPVVVLTLVTTIFKLLL